MKKICIIRPESLRSLNYVDLEKVSTNELVLLLDILFRKFIDTQCHGEVPINFNLSSTNSSVSVVSYHVAWSNWVRVQVIAIYDVINFNPDPAKCIWRISRIDIIVDEEKNIEAFDELNDKILKYFQFQLLNLVHENLKEAHSKLNKAFVNLLIEDFNKN